MYQKIQLIAFSSTISSSFSLTNISITPKQNTCQQKTAMMPSYSKCGITQTHYNILLIDKQKNKMDDPLNRKLAQKNNQSYPSRQLPSNATLTTQKNALKLLEIQNIQFYNTIRALRRENTQLRKQLKDKAILLDEYNEKIARLNSIIRQRTNLPSQFGEQPINCAFKTKTYKFLKKLNKEYLEDTELSKLSTHSAKSDSPLFQALANIEFHSKIKQLQKQVEKLQSSNALLIKKNVALSTKILEKEKENEELRQKSHQMTSQRQKISQNESNSERRAQILKTKNVNLKRKKHQLELELTEIRAINSRLVQQNVGLQTTNKRLMDKLSNRLIPLESSSY